MSEMKKDSNPTDNTDVPKQEASTCGSGCGCHTAGRAGKTRLMTGVIVLVAAGVLVARAVMKDNAAPAVPAATGFATQAAAQKTPAPDAAVKTAVADAPKELGALSELNAMAKDMDGVFVVYPDKTGVPAKETIERIRSASRTIESQTRGKIGIFMLKAGSSDYQQASPQITVPGVTAMVKGRGMAAVSGEITETKLVQAYVAASSAGGGCGPSSGGCGPSGCK